MTTQRGIDFMKLSELNDEINKALADYGPAGDKSLEYYGLVVEDGVLSSSKVYRNASANNNNQAELMEKDENYAFAYNIVKYAKIYDFSERKTEKQGTLRRIVFEPYIETTKNETLFLDMIRLCRLEKYQDYFVSLMKYYSDMHFTSQSPLLKMGIEQLPDGSIREAKAYFTLKSYDDKHDNSGRRYYYRDCKKMVDESLRLLDLSYLSEQYNEIAEIAERYEYFPVFTGINFGDDYVEMKIYFESCFTSYDDHYILNQENGLTQICYKDISSVEEFHDNLIKNGTYMDLITYSVRHSAGSKDTVLWRPYYLPLEKHIIDSRKMIHYDYENHEVKKFDNEKHKEVLLVDNQDKPLEFMNKKQAHEQGRLHRAFSIFLFDRTGRMLIQRRALGKYHTPGLLSNACCGHPLTSFVMDDAKQRLHEELGIVGVNLDEIFSTIYQAEVGNGLIEYEYDHVFIGQYDGEITIDPDEASEAYYLSTDEIEKILTNDPEEFTPWFRILAPRVIDEFKKNKDTPIVK